jgi:nitrogenase molybdenum-iron protein alpha/beta subunit
MLPPAQPVFPSVWVQKVTTGFERLTVMLVYEPAGTVADVPRKAESLCNLVRSTLRVVLFSGIFTLVPVDDVRVMVFTSTMKERRLVLGGGESGVAFHVMLSVAVPPPPQFTVQGFGELLHEIKATVDSKTRAAKPFRKVIEPPRQIERRA